MRGYPARGRYDKPVEETALVLPPLGGEHPALSCTWRRASFSQDLLGGQRPEGSALEDCRARLQGQPGLRFVFRWGGAFLFNVKGVMADVAPEMVGTLWSIGETPQELGELVTADDAEKRQRSVQQGRLPQPSGRRSATNVDGAVLHHSNGTEYTASAL